MIGRLKFDIDTLVKEMLDQLPESVWTSTDTTFLDPCMGGGQFVAEIERRLIAQGHAPENVAQRVYGFENNLMRVNYAINKHKLVGTYSALNFLEVEVQKKFDVIVGNPPYQSDQDRASKGNKVKGYKQPLWPLFVNNSLDRLTKDGILAMITPLGWLAGTYDIREGRVHLVERFTTDFNITYANINSSEVQKKYFPGIGSSFSWYIVHAAPYQNQTRLVTEFGESKLNLNQTQVIPPSPHPLKLAISNKTLYTKNEKWGFKSVSFDQARLNQDESNPSEYHLYKGYCNGGQFGKKIMYSYWKSPDQYYGIRKVVLGKQDRSYYPFVDTEGLCIGSNQFWQFPLKHTDLSDSAIQVFNSKLFKFLIMEFKYGAGPETILVKNLPKVDLTRSWTDQELYDHFGLTQEEIEYIETTVK